VGVIFLTHPNLLFAQTTGKGDTCDVSGVSADSNKGGPITDQTRKANFTITPRNNSIVKNDKGYIVKLNGNRITDRLGIWQSFNLDGGALKINNMLATGVISDSDFGIFTPYTPRTYTFSIYYNNLENSNFWSTDSRDLRCVVSFVVPSATQVSDQCTVDFPGQYIAGAGPFKFRVPTLPPGYINPEIHTSGGPAIKVIVKPENNSRRERHSQCFTTLSAKKDIQTGADLTVGLEKGFWYLEVRGPGCSSVDKPLCSDIFEVVNPGEKDSDGKERKGGKVTGTPPAKDPLRQVTPPCTFTRNSPGYNVEGNPDAPIIETTTCKTGLGIDFDVSSPQTFIKGIFSFILALAGTAAFLILIYAGYIYMTSAGDKTKVQAARDTITSAIAGLLFLIFSITILEIIGIDILALPGFGR